MATRRSRPKARREYGSGSVHQRASDGRWIGTVEAGWTSTGKRRRVTVSAATEKACRDKLKIKRAEVDSGVVTTAAVTTTVKMWSDEWLEKTQHKVRPSTWSANRSAVRQWIVPTFGHKRIGQVVPEDVEAMHDAMRDADLASSSMNRTHNVFNKMIKDAVIKGHRVHPGLTLLDKPAINENDRTAMPLPHAMSMLRVIEVEPDPSRWVAVILNGVRQGERLGLTWDCIDFDEQVINVRHQLQEMHYKDPKNKHLGFRLPDGYKTLQLRGRWHLVPTKTKAGVRVIPMTKWMVAALRAWRDVAPPSPHNLVWPAEDGGPIDPKDDREEWQRLQDEAFVLHPTGRHYDVHEGRHTTITLLKSQGVDEDTIKQIVGQSRLVQSYIHVDQVPRARAALEELAEHLALGR